MCFSLTCNRTGESATGPHPHGSRCWRGCAGRLPRAAPQGEGCASLLGSCLALCTEKPRPVLCSDTSDLPLGLWVPAKRSWAWRQIRSGRNPATVCFTFFCFSKLKIPSMYKTCFESAQHSVRNLGRVGGIVFILYYH